MSDIIKIQHSLARKAKYNPAHAFGHLYRIICREEWIRLAQETVLSSKGARSAGIDGLTKREIATEKAKEALVQVIRKELQERSFKPAPVRRLYIPKANGKKRPLGIPIIKDRVVQTLLKMILEPIWESDFLNCSNGFRPKRRTMDCIARLDPYINKQSRYYWVIEGDIEGAFDNIHHEILLKLLARRIADRQLLKLISRFLKAGIMEGGLFQRTEAGVPQGGPCSPLFANVYLHELDRFWWEKYGNLTPYGRLKRRRMRKGNCGFIRYADDWLLLTNGTRQEAERLREEFRDFLERELKLKMSVEKSRITHVNDGFDFLGFNIRRYTGSHHSPRMLVRPTKKTTERLKEKVRDITARARGFDNPLDKFMALNAVLRGWIQYYQHCNVKNIAQVLDFWVERRVFWWLQAKHKATTREILKRYQFRARGTRNNFAVHDGKALRFVCRMADVPVRKYRSRKPPNPYLEENFGTTMAVDEMPLSGDEWLGYNRNAKWNGIKAEIMAERGAKCELCGSIENLDVHHIKARQHGGRDVKGNAQLLCERCHVKTPTYGKHLLQ